MPALLHFYNTYCKRLNADCGDVLAWAIIEVAAWLNTCTRVRRVTSVAISASRSVASEFVLFSIELSVKLMVCSRRFIIAPKSPRVCDTFSIAWSN